MHAEDLDMRSRLFRMACKTFVVMAVVIEAADVHCAPHDGLCLTALAPDSTYPQKDSHLLQ
jgi:hypothetical protein